MAVPKQAMVLTGVVVGILVLLGIFWIIAANILSSETVKLIAPTGLLSGR